MPARPEHFRYQGRADHDFSVPMGQYTARMKKPIRFRAYADGKRVFWAEVRVFETRREMCRDIKRSMGFVDWHIAGQVRDAACYRNGRKTGKFSVMWLNREDVNKQPSEIAAHECVHAALRYFERRGWSACLHQETRTGAPHAHERWHEERLAYTVGRITKYLTRGLFRTGVWK